jgi:uncharacterized repeat protein (TIGR01451 family)
VSLVPGYVMIPGDFNGDGKLDFAYGGYYQNSIGLAFGNGDGTFSHSTSLPTDGYGGGFAIGDFNGDGKPDFVVANNSTGTINVFLGTQFSGLSVSSAHSGRFTAGSTGSYQITVTNPAYIATPQTVTVTDTLPSGLTAASISGSGWNCTLGNLTCTRSDILATGSSYPPITVSVNVSSGLSPSMINNQASVTYAGVTNFAVDPTVIVLPTTTSLSPSTNQAPLGTTVTFTATVTGTGGVSGSVIFGAGGNVLGSAVVSGGIATLSTRLLPVGVYSLKATYSGDSTHAPSRSSAVNLTVSAALASGLSTAAAPLTGTSPQAVATGDFDGDGKTDLVTANSTANTISVLLGKGDGSFRAKVDYSVGTQPVSVAVGDFNGDGKMDIAVANQSGKTLSILLGNGDGTFRAATSVSTGTDVPTSIQTVDWNMDGKADLLVVSSYTGGNGSSCSCTGSGNVFVFYGNGDGTFNRSTTNLSGIANYALIADFNGDGKPDLLVMTYAALYFYSGNGDGTLGSGYSSIGGSYSPSTMATGDLNGDGVLDVVTTDATGGVDVFIGNGDGSFRNYAKYTTGGSPLQVAIGDFNGDGKLDIFSANSASNTISVLLGNGDGTFLPQETYQTGSSPTWIALGDWNGDARTDLAITNSSSNSVSIYLGILTPVLGVSSTHAGTFDYNAAGNYEIIVTNLGPGVTSGAVTLVDSLPTGMTATQISGPGWTCTVATVSCARSDSLAVGASFPLTLTVSVASNAISPAVNRVSVSGGGAVPSSGSDSTTIINGGPAAPVLSLPTNGATGVSLTQTLTWSASSGATSYDIYMGNSPAPLLVGNVSGTSYIPLLSGGTNYYWQVVAKNGAGSTGSALWSFTTITSGQSPRAVLRDSSGAIRMAAYASPVLSNSGGVFGSDPSVAEDASGNLYVSARDNYNAIWTNVNSVSTQTWSGWHFGGGVIQGVPSAAVDTSGNEWIASRDRYNSYWLLSYSTGGGFGTWTGLHGVFATDPVVTACGDGSIYVVGKDNYNALWSGQYIAGTGFKGWQFGGGIVSGKPSATCGQDNALYIVAQDNYSSTWMARVSGNTWTGWFNGGAVTSVNPRVATLGNGHEAIVILDPTGAAWTATFTEGTTNGWQSWSHVGGALSDIAPAAIAGQLYFIGNSSNGLWWWQQLGNQWTWIGNNGAPAGALDASPK